MLKFAEDNLVKRLEGYIILKYCATGKIFLLLLTMMGNKCKAIYKSKNKLQVKYIQTEIFVFGVTNGIYIKGAVFCL